MGRFRKSTILTIFSVFIATLLSANVAEVEQEAFKKRVLEVLRDDCANCHGLYRHGGLGPPLTPERLKKMPLETIEIMISEGVPGKFMPPWKGILNAKEIHFLARYLQDTPAKMPQIRLRELKK
jgi:cytochrome c55X